MRSIIFSGMNARLIVVAVAAALIFLGVSGLRDAPKGLYPEFSPVYVEVQTEALGLSADEIEQLLTVALEQDLLNGIAYMREIWSESMPGLSKVVCVFEPGTDPMVARQVVAERMTQAHALPNVSKPPIMLQPYSSTSRVMNIGLTPANDEMSLIDLSVLARWNIQPYLMGVEGVANVSIWGQRKRQLQVQVDPQTLAQRDVTLYDVIKTTGETLWVSPLSYLESSTPGTGGFFDTPNQRLGIRHLLPITTPQDLAQVPLHGHNMLLGDVAHIEENHQPLIGDAIIDGTQGLMLVIEKYPWANEIDVTKNVEKALEALAPGLDGVKFDTEIYRPADYATASFDNISQLILGGLLLVIALFALLFYDWKSALISTLALALSLIAGATVLYLRGSIFDLMVISGFAMALAILIDDALSSIVHVKANLAAQAPEDQTSFFATVQEAVVELRGSAMYATGIILLAVVPIFFVGDILGEFLKPMMWSYILAVAASTLTALLVTPALILMFYDKDSHFQKESPVLNAIRKRVNKAVATFVERPTLAWVSLCLTALLGATALYMSPVGPWIPLPQERDVLVSWNADAGTSHPKMVEKTSEAIDQLKSLEGVESASAHIGRAVMSDKTNNVHEGEIWLTFNETVDYDQTMAAIQHVIDDTEGINGKVMTYREQSLEKSLTGPQYPYAVRVYGENQEMITQKAEEVQKAISSVDAVSNAKVMYAQMEPTLEIKVDLEKAQNYNLKPGDVRRTAATLLAGIEVGYMFEGQKVFDVVVWGKPEIRQSVQSVQDLLVGTPDGNTVRLGDVAEVTEVENPAVIAREKVSRFMDVSFEFDGGVSEAALALNIERELRDIDFPLEYHAEVMGTSFEKATGKSQSWAVIIACLLGIFLILQAASLSWRMALIALPSLFIALSGGFVASFLGTTTFNIASLAGLLSIFGLATYQILTMIKHLKKLELEEDLAFGLELVQRGIHDRLGSILMTNLTTLALFLPLAFWVNTPGFEVIQPMSLVFVGGWVTSFMVTLFVLPALYLALGKTKESVWAEEKSMKEIKLVPYT
ncbi:MAG: efflux RND transporter permease subunit [Bacteroidota bacterium]